MNIAANEATAPSIEQITKEIADAVRAGHESRALELANAAIENGLRHPSLFRARAALHGRQERFEEALADLESACVHAPRDPTLLDAIGHCQTMLNRPHDAVASFDAAIAVAPDFIQAHYRKSVALGMLNKTGEMQQALERVVTLKPDHVDALASLALVAARMGDQSGAKTYGRRAIACKPGHPVARVAMAIADIDGGDIASAKSSLSPLLAETHSSRNARVNMALGYAADAFDRSGLTAEAFALNTSVNEWSRAVHLGRFESQRAFADVESLISHLPSRVPWADAGRAPDGAAGADGHVFLLGFPRSGTTLLETVMATHDRLVVSDERDFLEAAANALLRDEIALDRLAAFAEDDAHIWQDSYWKAVCESGLDVTGRVFLDKLPLNSLRLPLISRLFPHARILLALRDPRDVVLSCFRHRFRVYANSFEFLRIEDCARYYSAVMSLVQLCRERLTLNLLECRYEELVDDFDGTVRGICRFVGVDWSDSLRNFSAAAERIDRRSQSAAQVRRGLYKGAIGQWRRYRPELAPAIPHLQPWIKRFGYPDD
ncbi:MAG TPA: sulfotransferase [Rhizomicrobium sp.]|jgi:tetratricopeptide (TPR) repeat protein